METKSSIRKQIKSVVKNIENKQGQTDKVCVKLCKLIESLQYKNILLFMPMADEIDIKSFTAYLLKNQKNVYVPVSFEDSIMKFYRLNSLDNLKIGKYGISEPIDKDAYVYNPDDIIIVPGVCFDLSFNRLGRGKGYYDIFLAQYPMRKIAVCFNEQLMESIPANNHDIKMDMIICEKTTLNSGNVSKNN